MSLFYWENTYIIFLSHFYLQHFQVFHEVGQKFAREFPNSLKQVQKLQQKKSQDKNKPQVDLSTKKTKDEFNAAIKLSKKDISQSKSIFDNLKFTKIGEPTLKAVKKSSVLLKYKRDKANISSPTTKHSPQMETRPSSRSGSSSAVTFEPFMNVRDSLTWEALQFMRGIMDECTHIGNFPEPVDPSLIIIVAANDDAYMPHSGVIPLTQLWPGSELRTLNTGHISAFLFNQQVFRNAIRDSFSRTIDKYFQGESQSTNELKLRLPSQITENKLHSFVA